eukprot:CAMPEP_0201714090 /NCGR_PEP_ID=MMETSP0593-20130828/699_1 /ASSEMBLY_ACC=CAM_ASM_000672 /TAXON_ID=267983 /ORGANISM="Skeletonema japonicum, Strain CCMP2506" /LENGTH=379 /DNA_ID=CAMNT_0048203325 /DNA_START=100 /DNA_END=1239 /DNA_ORIENTATION=+
MRNGDGTPLQVKSNYDVERQLSGSGDYAVDMEDMDDDASGGVRSARYSWYTSKDKSIDWSGYNIMPKKCIMHNGEYKIAYEMFKNKNNGCKKHSQGIYLAEVGAFAEAYALQSQYESLYTYGENQYGNPESLDYASCTAFEEANDDGSFTYVKLGCSDAGGLKLFTYSDSSCTVEITNNIGVYNDMKITLGSCVSCTTTPSFDDDATIAALAENGYTDDYAPYDAKLCATVHSNKEMSQSCGWSCKRQVKKGQASSSGSSSSRWNALEKFFLFFWSFAGIGLVWVVLKQRRMMSREDAIVEEAAMNGVGIKKRHVFPIALAIVFLTLLSMFMVWKKMTWLLLIGANVGLFAQFVFLRRKAKRANAAGDGYVKDAGLQIS